MSSKSEELHKVFVYGTLKKGEPNHSWFSKSADGYYKFIGNGKTTEVFPLIITTKYNVPFVLKSPGLYEFVCMSPCLISCVTKIRVEKILLKQK